MKKELKDYLHLYLGCEVLVEGDIRKLITIYLNGYVEVNYNDIGGQEFPINEIKPILRPLSDMTEDEEYDYWKLKGGNASNEFQGETTLFLLSKYFDIFGLIEADLAIDKTTLK